MTTRFKVELEHLPNDVEVDVELWTSGLSGRKEFDHEGHYIDGPGRKDGYMTSQSIPKELDRKGQSKSGPVNRLFVLHGSARKDV